MNTKFSVVLFSICLSCLSSCRAQTDIISEADEKLASTNALNAFAKIASNMSVAERQNIYSIESLYLFSNPDDQNLDGFESSGSSWSFIERAISARYSYLVFPLGEALSPNEAIFIAIPKSLQVDASRSIRMALTHDLKIIELSGKEFHQRLARQFAKK